MNNNTNELISNPMEISGILSRLGLKYAGWSSFDSAVAKVYKVKSGEKSYALRIPQLMSRDQFDEEITNSWELVKNSQSPQVTQDVLPHVPHIEAVDPRSKYVLVDWVDGIPLMEKASTLSIAEIHKVSSELVKYMNGWHSLGRMITDIDTPNKMDRILVTAKQGLPITWIDLDANTMEKLDNQLKVKGQFSQPEFQDKLSKFQGIEQIVTILTNSHLNAVINHVNSSKVSDLIQEFSSMREELTGQLNQSVLEQLASIQAKELSKKYGVVNSTAELLQVMGKALSMDNAEEGELYLQSLSEKNKILLEPDAYAIREFSRINRQSIEQFASALPSIAFTEEAKPKEVNDHLGYIRMTLRNIESLPDVAVKSESFKILEDYGKLTARIIDFLRKSGKFQNQLITDIEQGFNEGISLAHPRRNMSDVIALNLNYVLDEYLLPESNKRKSGTQS
jgi:hypothetical protein